MGNLCDTECLKESKGDGNMLMGGVCKLYYTICLTSIYKGRLKDVKERKNTIK